MKSISQTIIGVDPGTSIMGYGIIQVKGEEIRMIETNVLKLGKILSHHDRLKKIYSSLYRVIKEFKPDTMAIEAPFYGKNVQSMLKLGRAQGVAITVAVMNEIPVEEYSPRKIKQSITGNGNASKEQVAAMMKQLFDLKALPKYFDETDALAVALCHHFQNRTPVKISSGYSGWESFINLNPHRIKKF